ncbi:MAG: LptA/OstA family protein [Alphaproteobacteria bacterium]
MFTAIFYGLLISPLLAETMEVTAADGLEWHQKEGYYLAKGKAVAKKGEWTLNADSMRALYDAKANDAGNITELEASKNVLLTNQQLTVTGDQGHYDVQKSRGLVSGGQPHLVMKGLDVTASNNIEYLVVGQKVIARGNVVAKHDDGTLQGDVVNAWLMKDAKGQLQLKQITAEGNVKIVSKDNSVVTGEKGFYSAETGISRVSGMAKLASEVAEKKTAKPANSPSLSPNSATSPVATEKAPAVGKDIKLGSPHHE